MTGPRSSLSKCTSSMMSSRTSDAMLTSPPAKAHALACTTFYTALFTNRNDKTSETRDSHITHNFRWLNGVRKVSERRQNGQVWHVHAAHCKSKQTVDLACTWTVEAEAQFKHEAQPIAHVIKQYN